jgi:ATPase subunit of ABC transporter with duplicated ATPase domains
MIDISIQNVVKAFEEGNDILKGVTFDIYEGEHIGLLGKNGAGKTTLFRIITGALAPDEGEVILPAGKKIGLISQIPVFPEQYTTEDVLRTAFSQLYALEEKLGRLARQMEQDPSDALLSEYDALAERFRALGGYDTDYEINAVANGLEIPETQRRQLFSTLSGGEKTRVNLARLILEKTDILLLDEPTNHLDMKATQWLEEYVGKFKGTVLIISHDRYFLDRTVTRTVEILNGEAAFYAGNYSYYVVEKQRRYEEQLKKYEREQAEIRRLQQAADRLHQWGTGNKNLMKKSFASRAGSTGWRHRAAGPGKDSQGPLGERSSGATRRWFCAAWRWALEKITCSPYRSYILRGASVSP